MTGCAAPRHDGQDEPPETEAPALHRDYRPLCRFEYCTAPPGECDTPE